MAHRSRRVEFAKRVSTSNLYPSTRYSTSKFSVSGGFSPRSSHTILSKLFLSVKTRVPHNACDLERNRIRFFDDNWTQSFGQWSRIAKTEKTETESIRVSRELLHTLRDRSRGEGMVRGGGWENDRDCATLVACEQLCVTGIVACLSMQYFMNVVKNKN